jgi:hypothetical protein
MAVSSLNSIAQSGNDLTMVKSIFFGSIRTSVFKCLFNSLMMRLTTSSSYIKTKETLIPIIETTETTTVIMKRFKNLQKLFFFSGIGD